MVYRSVDVNDTLGILSMISQEMIAHVVEHGLSKSSTLSSSSSSSSSDSCHGSDGETFHDFSERMDRGNEMSSSHSIMFGTQLRMIKGCSASRVEAIIEKYPTARLLCQAYQRCENEAKEVMDTNLIHLLCSLANCSLPHV